MKRNLIQICLVMFAVLLIVGCDNSSEIFPKEGTPLPAVKAITRVYPVLTSDVSGTLNLRLPAEFCHPSSGNLSTDWKLYGAPAESTGMGKLLQKKTTEGTSCIQDISFEQETSEPYKYICVIMIYDLNSKAILAYGTSNTIIVE